MELQDDSNSRGKLLMQRRVLSVALLPAVVGNMVQLLCDAPHEILRPIDDASTPGITWIRRYAVKVRPTGRRVRARVVQVRRILRNAVLIFRVLDGRWSYNRWD